MMVPFLISATVLNLVGYYIMKTSPHPISNLTGGLVAVCVVSAAIISVLPFMWDAKAALRSEELDTLAIASSQIKDVQRLVDSISTATAQWMTVQEHSAMAVEAARTVSSEMTAEAKRFSEFMAQANDREKSTLKLEVEKLKRGEAEWLQVVVVMLDHVYALYHAALRSEKQNVINQLTNFRLACHEAARRMGLVPFIAEDGDSFDGEKHQWAKGDEAVPAESAVHRTVVMGLTFQGQQIRRAVVVLEGDEEVPSGGSTAPNSDELPLS